MLLALLASMHLAGAQPAPVGPAAAVIEAVERSIQQVHDRHAALPPPRDDAERLVRLGELDQAARKVMVATDFSQVPTADRAAMMTRIATLMDEVDAQNQAALQKLLPPEGWFLRSRYGREASGAAFHIVQHAGLELQQRFLPVLEPLVAAGEVDGQAYGLMFDRVAIQNDRPQRYGTQFRCDGGKWRPYPMESPEQVEARRSALQFPGTFAATKARFEGMPPCPQTPRPPPAGMKLD